MITHNLGYPRIGTARELKKACESFWAGKISQDELIESGRQIRLENWQVQKDEGIGLIPSNDFSFYDHMLDMTLMVGAVPDRFICLKNFLRNEDMEFYFALARGYQKEGFDVTPMEMTKWFNTNYHYIVPEFKKGMRFKFSWSKCIDEFLEAKKAGFETKPVLTGPLTFLMLGKVREDQFDKLELLPDLLSSYVEILSSLAANGASWVQLDEPLLVTDISESLKKLYKYAYSYLRREVPDLKILLATFFDGLFDNASLAASLPVDGIHLDLVEAPGQLKEMLDGIPGSVMISLGLVDGRNIWKNDFANSLRLIKAAKELVGEYRIMIAPSCSLIHVPLDIELETDEKVLPPEIKDWMAFARQKTVEVATLASLSRQKINDVSDSLELFRNQESLRKKKSSRLIHNCNVKEKASKIDGILSFSRSSFSERKEKQNMILDLPIFPSTTIGSFPQTNEVRSWRSKLKKGEIDNQEYILLIKKEIEKAITFQEEAGLDVLVHGEFERNDMVEYFGEMLDGYAFTKNGWIQSYGSRCVKPPIIFGDVGRPGPMTIEWIKYAQSLTEKPVKGILTGPVTMLQWSFVRNDQPRSETCFQIALAIRDEAIDLEKAGIRIIQIDEPALREGLPLRKASQHQYLDWAIRAFRLTYSGVSDETQIHTHMCYSEFNDIIRNIAAMDADVITIECSRSQMELLDVFAVFSYPNDIGPGVYDIHSTRIPDENEISGLLRKAMQYIPEDRIWVNPDCGLKTRSWEDTKKALSNMVKAARMLKKEKSVTAYQAH